MFIIVTSRGFALEPSHRGLRLLDSHPTSRSTWPTSPTLEDNIIHVGALLIQIQRLCQGLIDVYVGYPLQILWTGAHVLPRLLMS